MKAVMSAGLVAVTALLLVTPQNPGYAAPAAACRKPSEPASVQRPVPLAQSLFGAGRIWPMSTGSGVTIAVLDSGVDVGHPQLRGPNIGAGTDFYRRSGSGSGRYDCDGHGTAVTSLIAAQKLPDVGFQGLAYGARILPVVVRGEQSQAGAGTTSPEKFAKAMAWAVAHDADVIQVSVTYGAHPAIERAVADAVARNVVVVASVGDGAVVEGKVPTKPGPTPYPAAYHGVIGVAAVDEQTYPLQTSPWGPYVDLVAPGSNVQGASRGDGHVAATGSSFAAAFVTASAALVRSKWPELSAAEVARRLFATASPAAGGRPSVGYGMVDPYRALTEGLSGEAPASIADASARPVDPQTTARIQDWEVTGRIALAAAGVGIVLAGVMLAMLTLVPKGFRRRWRPGRARSIPEPKPDDGDLPPAPVKLFENLETE